MPEFAIFSDLGKSAFAKAGIGSRKTCIKVFESEDEANEFVEKLLATIRPRLIPEDWGCDTLLETFQEGLNCNEVMWIVPVVE